MVSQPGDWLLRQVEQVKWRSCLGESLQLCINKALSDEAVSQLPEILTKCRNISEYFRDSTSAEEQLEQAQQEMGLPQKKLKFDSPERWNSLVEMMLFV